MTKPHGSVLTYEEFLDDFEEEAKKAEHARITTQAMVLLPDVSGKRVLSIFSQTPTTNKKSIYFDSYSRFTLGYMLVGVYKFLPFAWGRVQKMNDELDGLLHNLRNQNVHVVEQNTIVSFFNKIFPFVGRNHIKGTYFDTKDPKDAIFYIQTANYERGPYKTYDLIIKTTGPIAKKLIGAFDQINKNPPQEDYSTEISDMMTLFVDCGKPNTSLILEKGIELIKNAQHTIELCSLFYPDGKIAKALSDKTREWKNDTSKTIEVIISNLSFTLFPLISVHTVSYFVQLVCIATCKLHNYSFPTILKPMVVHPKYLMTDNILFFGSHNLSQKGVQAGTREMQVLITDPEIVKNARAKFKELKEEI